MKNTIAKIARVKAGLRQIDLAMQLNVSPSLISLYEDGTKTPSPEMAQKINNILGARIYPEASAKGGR